MADNIYEIQFCFVDSSVIISNYFFNYYIIARYNMFSMKTTKINTQHQLDSILCHSANGTAITSAMWNITYASTKQNDIV